ENGFPIYRTTCIRKNGSKLVLEHNSDGNVVSRTLHVRQEAFATEDRTGIGDNDIALVTKSTYNKHSALTSSIFPAGNKAEWVYSEDQQSPLNQGNLFQVIESPQTGVQSDHTRIVTKYAYEPRYQLVSKVIDPRGNETSYEHD